MPEAAAPRRRDSPDPSLLTPSARKHKAALHILIATDVHDTVHLSCLRRCLDSLSDQVLPCTVHVGWHAPSGSDLHRETKEALEAFTKCCDAVLLESPTRRSQFEHFAALTANLAECVTTVSPAGCWVLFHDDDDISSENRHASYWEAILRTRQKVVDMGEDPEDVRSPRVIHCNSVAIPVAPCTIKCADDVQASFDAGNAALASDDLDLKEYWSFAVRLDLLSTFLAAQRPAVLAHRLCDLRFREWLGGQRPCNFQTSSWLYYYDDAAFTGDLDSSGEGRHGDHEKAPVARHSHRAQSAEDLAIAAACHVLPTEATRMRRIGETGFIIGFDGPILNLAERSDGELRERAVELMLKALKLPRVDAATHRRLVRPDGSDVPSKWDAMADAERACHVRAAQMLAERLVAEARRTLSSASSAPSSAGASGKPQAAKGGGAGKAAGTKAEPGIDSLGKALAKKVAATAAAKAEGGKAEGGKAEGGKAEAATVDLSESEAGKKVGVAKAQPAIPKKAASEEAAKRDYGKKEAAVVKGQEPSPAAPETIRIGDEDALVLD